MRFTFPLLSQGQAYGARHTKEPVFCTLCPLGLEPLHMWVFFNNLEGE